MLCIKECPESMRQQAKANKKDLYIEITNSLLAHRAGTSTEVCEYAGILMEVLDAMDPMLYELYRALSDRFVESVKALYQMKIEKSVEIDTEKYEELIAFGEKKHFLMREWFFEEKVTEVSTEGMQKVKLKLLLLTPRSISFMIMDGGKYETLKEYDVYLNGRLMDTKQKVVRSLFDLLPDHSYKLTVISKDQSTAGILEFLTDKETVSLNVRDFGAMGDGVTDDTHPIQTAIMNCPKGGRVVIPEGCFLIKSIFLKSNIKIELNKGAVLKAIPERRSLGYTPGVLPSTDGMDEYHMGTWEGNPEVSFAGIISGIEIENVYIYGEGTIDGSASRENWWHDHRTMRLAYRPKLFFIRDCKKVYLQGITLTNSPSWTMHPFFSDDLGFYDLNVENPYDSPNTDGFDPESCNNVEVAGVRFCLGDDCIAVKAGKIYMGRKYKRPSENIIIHNCLMQDGHGAVTVGSEMAGGVKKLIVEDCAFVSTDRGLRIKTRRGRGKDAILDQIIFRNIEMDNVMTPFVVNCFYFCDPDGKTDYVQNRSSFPVDDRTPEVRRLIFENINARNCHVAAAYVEGLPEKKIEELIMRNITVTYANEPKCDVPAMSIGVDACSRKGIYLANVKRVELSNVSVTGNVGDEVIYDNVDQVIKKDKPF